MSRVASLLVIAAAALAAFLFGVFAPASLKQPLQRAGQALASAPPASSAAAAASAASAPAAPASVPLASLLLPSVPSTTATYALQAGQFAARESADRLSASLSGQGVTSTVVLTVDTRGTAWAIVTLGRFSSAEEADSQRSYLANKLGLANALPIIVLPPPAPGP